MNHESKRMLIILISSSVVVALSLLFIFSGKSSSEQLKSYNDSSDNTSEITSEADKDSEISASNEKVTDESDQTVVSSSDDQTLAVSASRCTGCGKCALIDPHHFEMSERTATVISDQNLGSSDLKSAISNCRSNAITLS